MSYKIHRVYCLLISGIIVEIKTNEDQDPSCHWCAFTCAELAQSRFWCCSVTSQLFHSWSDCRRGRVICWCVIGRNWQYLATNDVCWTIRAACRCDCADKERCSTRRKKLSYIVASSVLTLVRKEGELTASPRQADRTAPRGICTRKHLQQLLDFGVR